MNPAPKPSPLPAGSCADPSPTIAGSDALAGRQILFVGGGNMAGAMIAGLLESGLPAAQVFVVEPFAAARQALRQRHAIEAFEGADAIADDLRLDAIVLAVKPQQAGAALKSCQGLLRRHPQAVLLSIAAGLGVELLASMSGGHRRIIRAMPNTPSLIGEGISGLFAPADADAGDGEIAHAILASTGRVVRVDEERLLDTVTAVSGSGPAYAFYLMEAMIQAGIDGGLDAVTARTLALHTVKGAAMLALASNEPPEVLRARVTSPAGTTAAAVAVLDQRRVKESLCDAVQAAASRSRQLSDDAKTAWVSAT